MCDKGELVDVVRVILLKVFVEGEGGQIIGVINTVHYMVVGIVLPDDGVDESLDDVLMVVIVPNCHHT
jgi:hypothetical protein